MEEINAVYTISFCQLKSTPITRMDQKACDESVKKASDFKRDNFF